MLEHKLYEYGRSDYYPFHMPGHKRQLDCRWNPYEMDITEIDGFDKRWKVNYNIPSHKIQDYTPFKLTKA